MRGSVRVLPALHQGVRAPFLPPLSLVSGLYAGRRVDQSLLALHQGVRVSFLVPFFFLLFAIFIQLVLWPSGEKEVMRSCG